MIIYRFCLGNLGTNCYLVLDEKKREGVVIDPADEGDFLSAKILRLKMIPLFIIATHGHFDHILGAEEIRLNFHLPFLLNLKDEFLVRSVKERAEFWGEGKRLLFPKKWRGIGEGDKIEFGRDVLEVWETPGHTPGSISLYNKKAKVLFSGDLLFKEGVGRTDFSYSSFAELRRSLERVLLLPKDTLVYPGHGGEFVLGKWKLGV